MPFKCGHFSEAVPTQVLPSIAHSFSLWFTAIIFSVFLGFSPNCPNLVFIYTHVSFFLVHYLFIYFIFVCSESSLLSGLFFSYGAQALLSSCRV